MRSIQWSGGGEKGATLFTPHIFLFALMRSLVRLSTDAIQLTLTLKVTTALVVETLVTVNNTSPIQDYVHLLADDHAQAT